jgi:aspartate/methionine/tyrosine aminotransferase
VEPCHLNQVDFRLIDWIRRYQHITNYNLNSSGLHEPSLREMGIKTDYDEFLKETDGGVRAENLFKASVASLYHIDEEEILPTVGASEAIFLACATARGQKRAIVPLPNYEPLFCVPKSLGFKVKFWNGLKSRVLSNSLLLVSNANNPTGQFTRLDVLVELSKKAKRTNSVLFVDETFSDFCSMDRPTTTFNPDFDNIIANTLAKFYGLVRFRVGWLFANKKRMELLVRIKRLTTLSSPAYSLWIASQAVKKRRRFEIRAKEKVARGKKLVEEFIESSPGLSWSDPDGPPITLVNYRKNISSISFCKRAILRFGVLVSPADFFGSKRGFRLCFTSEKEGELVGGLRALAQCLKSVT